MKFSAAIKILFWSFFTISVLLFYFVVRNNPQNEHLKYIPAHADIVIVVDLNKLFLDYKNLIENDPLLLDSLFAPFLSKEKENDVSIPKISPFQKIAIYHLQEPSNPIDLLLFSFTASSGMDLLNLLNKYDETPVSLNQPNGGVIYWLKKANVAVMQYNDIMILAIPMGFLYSNDLLDELFLVEVYKSHFDNAKKLHEVNPEFATVLTSQNHIDYWKINHTDIVQSIGGQILKNSKKHFVSQNLIQLNVKDEGLVFNTFLTFGRKDIIAVQENNTPLQLANNESFKFSTCVSPSLMHEMLEDLIPNEQKYMLPYFNGKLCMSVHGFDNASLKMIRHPLYEESSNFKSQKIDTILINSNEVLSYPLFHLACQLSDNQLNEFITELDSNKSIIKQENFYSYKIPNILISRIDKVTKKETFEPQQIYFYIKDNVIVFSPTAHFSQDFLPEFRTFSLTFSFDKFAQTYVPRNKIDFFAVSFIPTFELDAFTINFNAYDGEKMSLNGLFTLKNKNLSHLIKLPMLLVNLSKIEFAEIIKAM